MRMSINIPQAFINKEVHGFYELTHTPGLFTHRTRPIWVKLVMDDFGAKYVDKEHTDYLMSVLCSFYKVEED